MSGTSLDGIDVAIVDIRGKRIEAVAFRSTPYPEAVREALLIVSKRAQRGLAAEFPVGRAYTPRRLATPRSQSELIGMHGQTSITKVGRGSTLQIGEAAVVAERTGIDIISNFREARYRRRRPRRAAGSLRRLLCCSAIRRGVAQS